MKIHKTTRITIEEQKTRTISVGPGRILGFCERCGAPLPALAPRMASTVVEASDADVGGLIEVGLIHYVEIRKGSESICGHSLSGIDTDPDRSQGQ